VRNSCHCAAREPTLAAAERPLTLANTPSALDHLAAIDEMEQHAHAAERRHRTCAWIAHGTRQSVGTRQLNQQRVLIDRSLDIERWAGHRELGAVIDGLRGRAHFDQAELGRRVHQPRGDRAAARVDDASTCWRRGTGRDRNDAPLVEDDRRVLRRLVAGERPRGCVNDCDHFRTRRRGNERSEENQPGAVHGCTRISGRPRSKSELCVRAGAARS
jgi:hypothetical protein